MDERPRIILPQDQAIKKALEDKLREYRERLEERRKEHPYMHPELFNRINLHAVYKEAVLERLLSEGEIDTQQFSLELNRKHGFFNADIYDNAASVIDDYCRTGGKNIRDGTGLITEK